MWTSADSQKLWFKTVLLTGALIAVVANFPVKAAATDGYVDGFLTSLQGQQIQAFVQTTPMALRGNAHAQFQLAEMYRSGAGVAKDEETAVKWYQRAAYNGSMPAQKVLVGAYQKGLYGLPADQDRAVYWQRKMQRMAQLSRRASR